ncbi:aldo/keto reductase [Nocardioides sp.]|uniref:aldo/keto reductase n=1 Tax=Nocardioides sp. TaxID=35761 RepID=UPI003D1416B5
MKSRALGTSGLVGSAIGLGCLGMSGLYGRSDDSESLRTISRAAELGVSFLDTSDVYGDGANEVLVGKAVRADRDRYQVITKFGVIPAKDGVPARYDGSPAYIRQACDASLRRMGLETIDLYLQHRVDPKVPIEESIGTLAELVAEGKVRYIGMSDATPDALRRAHAVHPVSVLQSEYSLAERGVEEEVLGVCAELGVGFMAFSPLSRGLLTGQLDTAALDDTDIRKTSYFPRVGPELLQANASKLDPLREIASEKESTPAQVALAWLLAQRPWVVPIPGARTVQEVESNAQAADIELTMADLERLDGVSKAILGARVNRR